MALRNNNLEMVRLREALYKADETGQNVEGALNNLRTYVYGHMNTKLSSPDGIYPPIQLKHTYERLLAAQNPTSDNTRVYQDAQAFCEQQNPTGFSGRGRVPCIEAYVAEHGSSSPTTEKPAIPSDMYKFDFVSPAWSPDFAGWTLLASGFLWLAFALRSLAGLVLRLLKR